MNSNIFLSNLPVVIVVVIFLVIYGMAYFFKLHKKSRTSPLTRELLRSPGESLRTEIENLTFDIVFYPMMLFLFPIMIFATYLSQIYFGVARENSVIIGIYVFATLSFIGFCSVKLWRLLKDRNNYRLGLDCEIAVGQELNQLMLEGCRVFHDFPVEEFNKKFNIDHIVVGTEGVFSVETKGRSKRNKIGGEEGATVSYDGQKLQFPGWSEHKPIEQAKANAKWLSEWLSKVVGENVIVHPVLALPGWYVDLKKTGDVFVFNGKNPQLMLRARSYNSLSETLIKQISYQLEQKCRNVEPTAYRQNKKNETHAPLPIF